MNNQRCIIKSEAAQNVLMNIKDNETKTITFQISKYNGDFEIKYMQEEEKN